MKEQEILSFEKDEEAIRKSTENQGGSHMTKKKRTEV